MSPRLLHCISMQGRGPSTHAYTHALEAKHHMFIKIADGKASQLLGCRALPSPAVGGLDWRGYDLTPHCCMQALDAARRLEIRSGDVQEPCLAVHL